MDTTTARAIDAQLPLIPHAGLIRPGDRLLDMGTGEWSEPVKDVFPNRQGQIVVCFPTGPASWMDPAMKVAIQRNA